MSRSLAFACALCVCLAPAALSQNTTPVCNAGINADGFIDFSGLPPAPTVPPGATSSPITVTLPVKGIAGLTVQVTIPALTSTTPGTQLYSVSSGTLNFLSDPADGYVQLEFSKPVYGVSFEGNVPSRGGSFSLLTNESTAKGATGAPPANFKDTVANETEPYFNFSNRLQAVGNISEAYLYFPYASFGTTTLSNVRVQSQASTGSAMVPREGLQQWLMSESASEPFAGGPSAALWPDQSGKGHDATQTGGIQNLPGQTGASGPNCRGAFLFRGQSYFNFNLPIDGWEEMTVFLVARTFADPSAGTYASESAAILWNENALWGNTFISPGQSTVPFRFGTEQVNNQPNYTRSADVGQDFTITRAVHNKSTDSLFVDSIPVLRQQNKQPVLAGTSGAAYLGRGINNTYFNGAISEVLVYNRVLSANEAASVESYLRTKFGTK